MDTENVGCITEEAVWVTSVALNEKGIVFIVIAM